MKLDKEPVHLPLYASPFFEKLMDEEGYSEKDKNIVRKYREDGILVIDEPFISEEDIERVKEDTEKLIPNRRTRIQDAWQNSEAIKKLATNKKVLEVLEILYGRKPITFQTLNFIYGTQQNIHSDTVHFNSMPNGFMCGVWIALEDVTLENGALVYAVGSHKIPEYDYQDFGISETKTSSLYVKDFEKEALASYLEYEKKLDSLIKSLNLPLKKIIVKKGQAIIWASNIFHGGSKITDLSKTRYSQVTHYFFENCFYYALRHSNTRFGHYYLREVVDISTGKTVKPNFNGKKLKFIPTKSRNKFNVCYEEDLVDDKLGEQFSNHKNRNFSKLFKIKLIDD